MLAIRFNRTGKKNRAAFRVVLQQKTQAPGRRHIELLGSYDPHSKVAVLKGERIMYWIGQGAEASVSVHNLLVREGIVKEGKLAVKMVKPVVKEEEKVEEVTEAAPAGEKKEEVVTKAEEKKEEKAEETAPAEEKAAE